jgi:magnesium chelatase family protein
VFAKVESIGLEGLSGFNVSVEVDIYNGMPGYETVGLPGAAVKESKDRVRSAIKNSNLVYPTKRITVNLAPADMRKEGPIYDLPIALGLLSASEQINAIPQKMVFFGELALDGKLRKVKGLLPMLIEAANSGFESAVIPKENLAEVACLELIKIYSVNDLGEVVQFLNGDITLTPAVATAFNQNSDDKSNNDFSHINLLRKVNRNLSRFI